VTHWNILFKFFNIASEFSKFFYYILAYENFACVSRGFSIKGQPNLAQEAVQSSSRTTISDSPL
jgi:hypothetical protein